MDLSLQAYSPPGFSVKGQETQILFNYFSNVLSQQLFRTPYMLIAQSICAIYKSFQVTSHCTEQTLYSLEKKLALLSQVATTAARRHAWPATQDPNS